MPVLLLPIFEAGTLRVSPEFVSGPDTVEVNLAPAAGERALRLAADATLILLSGAFEETLMPSASSS